MPHANSTILDLKVAPVTGLPAMPTLDVSELNIVTAILGSFAVLYGLFAVKIKSVWYLGEALPALLIGVLLGPVAAKFLDPRRWGSAASGQEPTITLGVMRIMIGVQLVIAGYQLPARFLQWRRREIAVCLIPVMTLMWLCTSMCILATIPNLPLLATLVIGACVTSTDPILSQAVAKGPFADKYVPRHLREIISAEAGANDGFASPFLMLSVNLMRFSIGRPETLVDRDRGVGPRPSDLGIAIGNWAIETLVYLVLLGSVYGALTGFLARKAVRFSLSHKWIDTESYLLFPTALGVMLKNSHKLFIVGTCGAIGTGDLLACFVAGCALNWDGQFLAEAERLGLGMLVLLFRRIPALLITYKAMPSVVKSWKEAVFMGYFGPIGVGAVYYLEHTRLLFNRDNPPEKAVVDALFPVVYFLVLLSIVVHGLSIPVLSVIYHCYGVGTITDDVVELRRDSVYVPTPSNAFQGDKNTFIVYNRFFRPLASASMLPLAHIHSENQNSTHTEHEEDRKKNETSAL
ncbi:hypothetical protein RRF57_001188 [Xylaria bambusicola]|uniref:Cation/H+ exchanger transmembrane domain-containing protein n=1 Tax=Xylaria bambusicola TaxID=326684 RepID=A0AAN7Z0H2_9PEZI